MPFVLGGPWSCSDALGNLRCNNFPTTPSIQPSIPSSVNLSCLSGNAAFTYEDPLSRLTATPQAIVFHAANRLAQPALTTC